MVGVSLPLLRELLADLGHSLDGSVAPTICGQLHADRLRVPEHPGADQQEPGDRAQAEPDHVGREVVGQRVVQAEHVRLIHRQATGMVSVAAVDAHVRRPAAVGVHRLAVPERPGAGAAVADEHAHRVGDDVAHDRVVGEQRLVGPAVAVHQQVEQEQRDDRRHPAHGEEPAHLRDEPRQRSPMARTLASEERRSAQAPGRPALTRPGGPSPRAISIRCTSEVPSPISSTFASR